MGLASILSCILVNKVKLAKNVLSQNKILFHSGKEAGKENRNRVINNKTKKKIQQAIHSIKCEKLIKTNRLTWPG